MTETTLEEAEQEVKSWMARHRPEIQGEKDGNLGIPAVDSGEITPYERQLVESFEKQVRMVIRRFKEKEADLYVSFKKVKAELKIQLK